MKILAAIHRAVIASRSDRGATAAEYAILASLIAVVILVAVALLGTNLLGLFDESASSYADAVGL